MQQQSMVLLQNEVIDFQNSNSTINIQESVDNYICFKDSIVALTNKRILFQISNVSIEVQYSNLVSYGKSGTYISLFLKGESQTDDDDGNQGEKAINYLKSLDYSQQSIFNLHGSLQIFLSLESNHQQMIQVLQKNQMLNVNDPPQENVLGFDMVEQDEEDEELQDEEDELEENQAEQEQMDIE